MLHYHIILTPRGSSVGEIVEFRGAHNANNNANNEISIWVKRLFYIIRYVKARLESVHWSSMSAIKIIDTNKYTDVYRVAFSIFHG